MSYLLSKQNTDGGFGSPSTGSGQASSVYETALAFDALIAAGANISTIDPLTDRTPAQGAINYLTSTQLTNGSWNDDPYSTALALQALANIRPDLSISSLSLSKAMPQEGETITITATVRNTGLDSASNVVVRFYQGDPSTGSGQVPSGGVQIGADQIIPSLSINLSTQVSISQSFTGTGSKTIFAVVDPDGLISETSEEDNRASTRLWVATAPDLAVFSEDLKPATFIPVSGTPFTLEYTIRNMGETSADSFAVALYDGDPSAGSTSSPQAGSGRVLSTANISGLAGGAVRTGTFGVTLTTDGPHTLYLVADPGGQVAELSETNNTASVTVQVGGSQTGADLTVTPMDVTLTPSRPTAGQTVRIAANIKNTGTDTAFGFVAEIFDGAPEAGGILLHSETLSLAPGVEQTVAKDWAVPAGIHAIQVVVDRVNKIVESNEANNSASVAVMTDMVDLSLSATDLVFGPSRPVVGDSVTLTITARNLGIRDTGAFNLALYNGDPSAGGVLLQTYQITNIAGDGNHSLSYSFMAQPQTYRFYAVADTENTVTELYESNNQAVRSLVIKGPGETYGPDLVPVKIDLTGTTTDPQTLAISGNALVTFQNRGDDKITSSFDILVFEDKDDDGRYTSGVDTILGTGTNALALWPEGANMVSVPLSGTVEFLNSPLYAFIDAGDVIPEQDETDNLIRSGSECEARPANPIQPVVKWMWNGANIAPGATPAIAPLIDTNGDGKIDDKDIPAVIFTYYGGYYSTAKALVALRGDTGAQIFSISDPDHPVGPLSYPIVGDMSGDGMPEIILSRDGSSPKGQGLLAYSHDGQLIWDNYQAVTEFTRITAPWNPPFYSSMAPALADLDADGRPEIVMGVTVVNPDGTIRTWANDYKYGSGAGYTNFAPYSTVVADLDRDGRQEIVAGKTAYNADGTTKWWNKSIPDGNSTAANLDDDPDPEIVLLVSTPGNPNLSLLDHNGNVIWGPVYLKGFEPDAQSNGLGGPPTIADFDGDGEQEIGVKGFDKYLILDRNGHLKNTLSMPYAEGIGGSSSAAAVFDLNGDGRPEVLDNSHGYFRIFDGKTGTLLYKERFGGGAGSGYQNVVMADMDGDGQVEVVVIGYDSLGNKDGLRVYKSDTGHGAVPWVGARKIWNQPSYHVTNVNDDGTIPQYEAPSWLLNNTYRCQSPQGQEEGVANPYGTPNLTASYLRASQDSSGVDLTVRIGNGGAKEAPAGTVVTFYDGPSAGSGQVIGTATTTMALKPGVYQDLSVTWTGAAAGLHTITAVVDQAGNIAECREDDNETVMTFDVKGPDALFGPDLVPVRLDVNGATTDTQTLAISGTALVTFQNRGDTSISAPFDVLVFEDMDRDNRYTQGVDTLLGSVTYPSTGLGTGTLWPNGANMLSVPLSGTVKFPGAQLAAIVDSGNVIAEQDETNNLILTETACKESTTSPIQPVVKWRWNAENVSPVTPVAINLTDDNNDGKIDGSDTPDIVFTTLYSATSAKLRAVDGRTGAELFSYYNTDHPIGGNSYIAAGDIDGDGLPELVVPGAKIRTLLAFEHTGELKWDNGNIAADWLKANPTKMVDTSVGQPVIADLDSDGSPEIVTGATVINPDGTIRSGKTGLVSGAGVGIFTGFDVAHSTIVADIDLDGYQEIIGENIVYNHDSTIRWMLGTGFAPSGVMAVGNFDDDPYAEIVVNTIKLYNNKYSGAVYMYEHDGSVKWGPVYLGELDPTAFNPGYGSYPLIADFDGDGAQEIGVKGWNKYFILDRNGKLKQTLDIPYYSYGMNSSPVVFDLNGDGRPEVMINSDGYFRIFDGRSGSLLYQVSWGGKGGSSQNVIISDIDNDQQVELIVTGDWYRGGDGMRVYESSDKVNHPWVNGRKIWNQPSYHVTNVNDDGSIPQHEAPSWLLNNTYRCQAAVSSAAAGSGSGTPMPNLTASYLRVAQDGSSLNMTVRVANSGAEPALSGVMVFFYDGDPATSGIVVGTAVSSKDLQPGEYQDIAYSWSEASAGEHRIVVVVDPNGSAAECREDDNQARIDVTVTSGLTDLAVASGDMTVPAGVHAEGDLVPVTVRINNNSAVSASNVGVSLYSGNPAQGGIPAASPRNVQIIEAGGSASLIFILDTLGRAGDNVLYAVVDPQNAVVEANEGNNTAFVTLAVQPPVLPNLAITADGIQLSPASAREGENITITATVMNRGISTSNIPVGFYRGDPASGGVLISEQTIYPVLALGGTATVTANLTTTGAPGEQNIFVAIDPANAIVESREDDNTASKAVFVQSAGLSSSVTLDKTAYQANETVTATITIINATADARSLVPVTTVRDGAGNLIAAVSPGAAVNIGPNSTVALARTWNTGKTLAGNYTVLTEVAEGSAAASRSSAEFTIAPDTRLDAKVTTDKISYNPKETVGLSATIASRSANYLFENLTAKLTIAGSGVQGPGSSTICTETKTINTLMPEAVFSFKSYCPAATERAGTYTVRLEVLSGQTVLAASTAGFEALSTAMTGAGLAGTIAAAADPVYQGREETFAISVTNNGIDDVTGLTVSVIIADPETGEAKAEVWSQGSGARRGETINGTQTVSTTNLAPKRYLAILQVRTAEMAAPRTLASALFEVKPGIEVAKKIPDVRNVLVWVNNNCGSRISDCGLESLEEALKQAVTDYRIVLDKKEFAEELGNIFYTDYLILGDHHPLEDHAADVLAARVAEGKGLLSSLFSRQGLDGPVFGIKFTGSLPGEGYVVDIPGNELKMQGSFPSAGRVLNIEALKQEEAIAWVTSMRSAECGMRNERSEICDQQSDIVKYPAIIKRQYGNGKVLFLAFDLAMSSANIPGFPALLRNALDAVHTPVAAPFRQGQPVPIEISIKSLGAAFDIRVSESYPGSLRIAECGSRNVTGGEQARDLTTCEWIADNPWVTDLQLEPNAERTLLFYALPPEQAGTYTLKSEIGYLDNGVYSFYQEISLDVETGTE